MLRKISITIVASAASMLLGGGIASAAEATIPSSEELERMPSASTYCDVHANDPCPPALTGSAIPPSDELVRMPSESTFSDRNPVGATGMDAPGGSAIPVQTDRDGMDGGGE